MKDTFDYTSPFGIFGRIADFMFLERYMSGWRGMLTAGLHGIGMMFLMAVTFYATLYCLHFAGLLDARYYPT